MDGVQLSQGYRATAINQFIFTRSRQFTDYLLQYYRRVPGTHLVDLEKMKGWVDLGATPSSFEPDLLDWESNALTTGPLPHRPWTLAEYH